MLNACIIGSHILTERGVQADLARASRGDEAATDRFMERFTDSLSSRGMSLAPVTQNMNRRGVSGEEFSRAVVEKAANVRLVADALDVSQDVRAQVNAGDAVESENRASFVLNNNAGDNCIFNVNWDGHHWCIDGEEDGMAADFIDSLPWRERRQFNRLVGSGERCPRVEAIAMFDSDQELADFLGRVTALGSDIGVPGRIQRGEALDTYVNELSVGDQIEFSCEHDARAAHTITGVDAETHAEHGIVDIQFEGGGNRQLPGDITLGEFEAEVRENSDDQFRIYSVTRDEEAAEDRLTRESLGQVMAACWWSRGEHEQARLRGEEVDINSSEGCVTFDLQAGRDILEFHVVWDSSIIGGGGWRITTGDLTLDDQFTFDDHDRGADFMRIRDDDDLERILGELPGIVEFRLPEGFAPPEEAPPDLLPPEEGAPEPLIVPGPDEEEAPPPPPAPGPDEEEAPPPPPAPGPDEDEAPPPPPAPEPLETEGGDMTFVEPGGVLETPDTEIDLGEEPELSSMEPPKSMELEPEPPPIVSEPPSGSGDTLGRDVVEDVLGVSEGQQRAEEWLDSLSLFAQEKVNDDLFKAGGLRKFIGGTNRRLRNSMGTVCEMIQKTGASREIYGAALQEASEAPDGGPNRGAVIDSIDATIRANERLHAGILSIGERTGLDPDEIINTFGDLAFRGIQFMHPDRIQSELDLMGAPGSSTPITAEPDTFETDAGATPRGRTMPIDDMYAVDFGETVRRCAQGFAEAGDLEDNAPAISSFVVDRWRQLEDAVLQPGQDPLEGLDEFENNPRLRRTVCNALEVQANKDMLPTEKLHLHRMRTLINPGDYSLWRQRRDAINDAGGVEGDSDQLINDIEGITTRLSDSEAQDLMGMLTDEY